MEIGQRVMNFIQKKPAVAALSLAGLAVAGGGAAIAIERVSHQHQRCNLKVPMPSEIRILPTVSTLHFSLNELGIYRRSSPANFERWGVMLRRLDELEAMRRSSARTGYASMTSLQRAMRKREEVEAAVRQFATEVDVRADELQLDRRLGSREAVEAACQGIAMHARTCVDMVEFFATRTALTSARQTTKRVTK